MATSVVPALIDALVTQITAALPNVRVYDGFGVSDDPGDYLMVGVEDPESNNGEAARADEEQATFGTTRPRQESGVIHMAALSWNGNGDQKAARDAAYATAAAVANTLRPNAAPDVLGVTGLLGVGYGASTALEQAQDEFGAKAALRFDIAFKAFI